MNPIYNEYLTFLRDVTGEKLSNLKEGYFWLDRQIIKGFDKQGNIHSFYRVNISDNMKVSFQIIFSNLFLFYTLIIIVFSYPDCFINQSSNLSDWSMYSTLHPTRKNSFPTKSLNLFSRFIHLSLLPSPYPIAL